MSRSDARHVARHENQSATEIAVTDHRARCSPQPALSVAKALKSRFSRAVTSQFIVAIATEKFD